MAARIATAADTGMAVRLLMDFYRSAELPFETNAAWAAMLFKECVADPYKAAFVIDGGILLAFISPSVLGPFRQAQEIAWYVDPDHRGNGLELLDAYEAWAIESGAKLISVASLGKFPDAERIYARRGYSRLETHWCRAI